MGYSFNQLVKNLPPSIREELLREIEAQGKQYRISNSYGTLHGLISSCITWDESKKGEDYWYAIYRRIDEIWENNIEKGNIKR